MPIEIRSCVRIDSERVSVSCTLAHGGGENTSTYRFTGNSPVSEALQELSLAFFDRIR